MTGKHIFAALSLALGVALSPPALAGPFDCAVVYDEFDSLMNKGFLMQPEAYGQVVKGRLSRADFNARQKGRLLLRPGREEYGVAIVRTNANRWGKLLFTWGGRGDALGTPLLILRDITLFANVEDGSGRRLIREVRVSAGLGADLDRGRVDEGEAADIKFHTVDRQTVTIEAANGAAIAFPMETLCR